MRLEHRFCVNKVITFLFETFDCINNQVVLKYWISYYKGALSLYFKQNSVTLPLKAVRMYFSELPSYLNAASERIAS